MRSLLFLKETPNHIATAWDVKLLSGPNSGGHFFSWRECRGTVKDWASLNRRHRLPGVRDCRSTQHCQVPWSHWRSSWENLFLLQSLHWPEPLQEQVSCSSTYRTDALGRGRGSNLSSSRGHTQHLSIVLVCTAVLGGLPPESFPDTLCYTLKVDGLDTGSGVDRMLAWENMQTTQEESLVVTERLPSPAPCGRTEAAMGPCLDWTRELSLVSYCLSRLPGTRKEDVACIETQVLFLNNTSLRKEEKPTEKWGPPTDETDRCYFS